VLHAISDLIEIHGYSPTVREIGLRAGLSSPSTVQVHIERLTRDKFVTVTRERARTIQVTEAGKAALEPKG
jgi:repressor LexA